MHEKYCGTPLQKAVVWISLSKQWAWANFFIRYDYSFKKKSPQIQNRDSSLNSTEEKKGFLQSCKMLVYILKVKLGMTTKHEEHQLKSFLDWNSSKGFLKTMTEK